MQQEELIPFPRRFPSPVLECIFSFLPWRKRIQLESCLGRECYTILRPSLCQLPLEDDLTVDIEYKGSQNDVSTKESLKENGQRIIVLEGLSFELVFGKLRSLTRQVPFSKLVLHWIEIGKTELDLVECCSRINVLKLYSRSATFLTDSQINAQYWSHFWRKLPKVSELYMEFDVVPWVPEHGAVDRMVLDLAKSGRLERFQYGLQNNSGMEVSEDLLLAASSHCPRLTYFSVMKCRFDFTASVVAFIENFANSPTNFSDGGSIEDLAMPLPGQSEIHVHDYRVARDVAPLMPFALGFGMWPVVMDWYDDEGYYWVAEKNPDEEDEICGFANRHLLITF